MAKKILNFDKFISEKTADTIELTIFGNTFEIPAVIPAIVPVMMARAEDDPATGTKMIMRAADIMFGKDRVNDMCEKGMTAGELADLVQRVFLMINGNDEDDDSEELSDEDEYKPADGDKNGKK